MEGLKGSSRPVPGNQGQNLALTLFGCAIFARHWRVEGKVRARLWTGRVGMRGSGLGFGFKVVGFWGFDLRALSLVLRVQALGFRVQGSGLRVFRIQGSGFMVQGPCPVL